MTKSENINELALALSQFQAKAINPFKDKQGSSYKYADLSSVLDVTRAAVSEHGLSFTQMPFTGEGTVGVETMLMHKSGQWISSRVEVPLEIARTKDGRATMTPAQASGSVITYLRRYALTAVLGIAQDDDDAAMQVQKSDTATGWINLKSEKPAEQQVPQAPVAVNNQPTTNQQTEPAPTEFYSDEEFEAKLDKWAGLIMNGKQTANSLINLVESKGKRFTDEQKMLLSEHEPIEAHYTEEAA